MEDENKPDVLIETCRSLIQKIDQRDAKIAQLKAQIEELKAKIRKLSGE